MNFFDLDLQYKKNKKKIDQAVINTLGSGSYILGKQNIRFEKKAASFLNCDYFIGTSSGTDSILVLLIALNIQKGDEVIIPAFSWLSVAEMVILLGAKPIYVDIQLNSFNLDPKDLVLKISKKTKAIISTSLFGYPCDLEEISKIAKSFRIFHIEDSSQSFGSKLNNKHLHKYSDACTYSFFPSKILGAAGDAGGIAINNKKLFQKILKLRNHGQHKYSLSKFIGINARMDEVQAALLFFKISLVKKEIKLRRNIVKRYIEILKDFKIIGYTNCKKNYFSTYSQFSILVKNRKKLVSIFKKFKIPLKIYYPKPLYNQFSQKKVEVLPYTEFCTKHVVSLPINIYSNKRKNFFLKVLKKVCHKYKSVFYTNEKENIIYKS